MAKPSTDSSTPPARSQQSPAVTAFMATLEHPAKREIEALRKIILGAHPDIGEGIKWNAPSFRTSEFFATVHLRAKHGVQLIFHLGAKARDIAPQGLRVDDPTQLLHWISSDRASVSFSDMKDVDAKRSALKHLVREWIQHV